MKIKWEKPRAVSVADMLYPDRGMIKWHGFILSDHNEVLAFEQAVLEAAKDETHSSPEDWDKLLKRAIEERVEVRLSLWGEDGTVPYRGFVECVLPQGFLLLTSDERLMINVDQVAHFALNDG